MVNAEKYRKEILENLNKDPLISVNKHNHEIEECTADNCLNCWFNVTRGNKSRFSAMLKWLLSEYKEPVKLTKLEYELLKFWNSKKYKYIARDSSDTVYVYREKPSKKFELWGSIYEHCVEQEFDKLFLFVKWEDEEPTSIKEVLENCEVVEDDL